MELAFRAGVKGYLMEHVLPPKQLHNMKSHLILNEDLMEATF